MSKSQQLQKQQAASEFYDVDSFLCELADYCFLFHSKLEKIHD